MKHRFKKKYGQNFLKSESILNRIIDSVPLTNNDLVIEIGPGAGALTEKILNITNKVICYEIDEELKEYLTRQEQRGAKIIYGDFLEQDVTADIKSFNYENLYIIANLPYYITTPIIEKIVKLDLSVKSCVFMVQKEVADRFSSKPSNKEYGSITVFLNYYFEIKKLFNVLRTDFYPEPNVDSAIIKLNKKNDKIYVADEAKFFKLIKNSFQYKRKNLKNNLLNYDLETITSVLNKYGLNLTSRAEQLSVEVFADISNNLK